jgi:hypothetical protein
MTAQEAREWVRQGGNVGIKLGDVESDDWTPLVVDVEEAGGLPDHATKMVERYTLAVFESPHGGRNRLILVTDDAYYRLDDVKTKIDLDSDGEHEVELLTSVHALVPPSRVNHSNCKNGKDGCPGHGVGQYELAEWSPNADVMTEADAEELFTALGMNPDTRANGSTTTDGWDGDDPDPDPALVDEGEAVLRTIQKVNGASFLALVGLLRGGTGEWADALTKGSSIDRSEQELRALTLFYQSAIELADLEETRAEDVAVATFQEYASKNPYTDDQQVRKWLQRGSEYQKDLCSRAFGDYDFGKFQRFLNLTTREPDSENYREWTDEYSKTTYSAVRVAVEYLSGELGSRLSTENLRHYVAERYGFDIDSDIAEEMVETDPLALPPTPVLDTHPPQSGVVSQRAYPTRKEVVALAQLLDGERDNSDESYRTALGRAKKEGVLVMAYCPDYPEEEQYVYYPYYASDPDAARWVRTEGEKRHLENESHSESISTSVTDG